MDNLVNTEEWKERFEAIGLDEKRMKEWHSLFEKQNPAGHQSFLEWLGVAAEEIRKIRKLPV